MPIPLADRRRDSLQMPHTNSPGFFPPGDSAAGLSPPPRASTAGGALFTWFVVGAAAALALLAAWLIGSGIEKAAHDAVQFEVAHEGDARPTRYRIAKPGGA